MKISRSFKLAGWMVGILFTHQASAVQAISPSAIFPEQMSRALQSQQPRQQVAQASPIQEVEKQAASPLGPEAQKIKFQLNGIILKGNYVYSTTQLRPLYQDKLGKTITIAQLFEIVQSITNYYRNNGYIISRAILPPQHVKNGVVEVQVIEGYIDGVEVTGNPRGAKCQVLAFGNQIRRCRPLQIKRMEKYLLLANEIPGVDVKAVLAPSKSETGAADLSLVTETSPAYGYLSYDNYGTRYIGPQQMTANLGFNSFIASGDTGQVTVTKTPRGKELTYTDVNYSFPMWDEGMRWLFGGTETKTHPLFILQPQKIDGLNNNYYTNINYPIIRTRTENLTLRSGFNYLDSTVTTFDEELYTDHVRSIDLGLTYNFTDRWNGANLISADLRRGLPILGYSSNTSPITATTSRPGGHANYTKFGTTLSRLQGIYQNLTLYGLVQGQWAAEALLASEQFSVGGSQLGRGYDVAEIIGDKGAAGSLELRYDWAPGKLWIQDLQFYTYYDIGVIWNYEEIGGIPTKISLSSTGVGTRFFFTKYITGNVMWTQPLTKKVLALTQTSQKVVNGQTINLGNGYRPRVFFSVVAAFG